MIVAVTGATGFIGRYVINQFLKKGHNVRALSRKTGLSDENNLHWITGDLHASVKLLDEFVKGADVVCHCAGELKNESQYVHTNYEGTINLVTAAVNSRVKRFIHLSSVGVYGYRTSGNIKETEEMCAVNAYEESKIMADNWLQQQKFKQMDLVILRPSIVFGADMPNESLRQWIQSIRSGRFVFVGKSGASANYIHVQTVADAIYSLSDTILPQQKNIYNLSDWMSVEDFVSVICRAADVKYPKIRLPLWFVKLLANCFDRLSLLTKRNYLLTMSRVDALTSVVHYDSTKIHQEIDFVAHKPLHESLYEVTQQWMES